MTEAVPEYDKRRNYAVFILLGGGMTMTAFSSVGLFLLQTNALYVFYLSLFAMFNIFIIFTALAGLLVKRSISVSRSGVNLSDLTDKQS